MDPLILLDQAVAQEKIPRALAKKVRVVECPGRTVTPAASYPATAKPWGSTVSSLMKVTVTSSPRCVQSTGQGLLGAPCPMLSLYPL